MTAANARTTERPHGHRAKYTIERCRCDMCRASQRDYERERAQRLEPTLVGADPARRHIAELMAAGVGLKTIIRAAGISSGALTKIVYGGPGTRPPSKRIRPDTLEKILAVTPADAADGANVDATRTWAHIDRLTAAGVPKVQIARRIGQHSGALQLGRDQINARHARAIATMAAELAAGTLVIERRDRRRIPGPTVTPDTTSGNDTTDVEPVAYDDIDHLVLAFAKVLEDRIDNATWRADSACRGRPVHIWFPARGDHKTLAAARRICAACIVRDQCLEANLDQVEGVYAGTTTKRRQAMRAERAARPTPDLVGAA